MTPDWRQPASTNREVAQQPLPRPIFRGKGPDEPSAPLQAASVRLSMPSPDQLGIASASAMADWAGVHRRLTELGALCVQGEKVEGGYRFTCLLPTAESQRNHRIEALAASEGEAVRLALDRCEQWAAGR
jgi:hypothetical protein